MFGGRSAAKAEGKKSDAVAKAPLAPAPPLPAGCDDSSASGAAAASAPGDGDALEAFALAGLLAHVLGAAPLFQRA